ncbi:hypothetical protein [Cryptosporangium minutisporangium]|uniref:hypothetical protein n=1 Tax=Cryptosporangium minutisporangium TaxID=113569 RepID=UPI0031E53921
MTPAAHDELARVVRNHTSRHLFHATRAELLRDLGDQDQARAADERALALTGNPAERSLLRRRLTWP